MNKNLKSELCQTVQVTDWLPDKRQLSFLSNYLQSTQRQKLSQPSATVPTFSTAHELVEARIVRPIRGPFKFDQKFYLTDEFVKAYMKRTSTWICIASPDNSHVSIVMDDRVVFQATDTPVGDDDDVEEPTKQTLEQQQVVIILETADIAPAWRRAAWSADSKLLAVASSQGRVDILSLSDNDVVASFERNLKDAKSIGIDVLQPLAFMFFSSAPGRLSTKEHYELVTIDYAGYLQSFAVSLDSPSSRFLHHEFRFVNMNIVTSAIYNQERNVLTVAGSGAVMNFMKQDYITSEVSTWKLLPIAPFYQCLDSSCASKLHETQPKKVMHYSGSFWWNKMLAMNQISSSVKETVSSISLSPDGSRSLTVTYDGTLTMWLTDVDYKPELPYTAEHKLVTAWSPKALNNFVHNQNISGILVDAVWWSDESAVLTFDDGSLTIAQLYPAFKIILDRTESFYGPVSMFKSFGQPHLTLLDCQIRDAVGRQRPDGGISSRFASKSEREVEDALKATHISWFSSAFARIIRPFQLITDTLLWHFESDSMFLNKNRQEFNVPLRKFTLWEFERTTPLELLFNKIAAAHYEEAESITATYNLDRDYIYKARWLTSTISPDSIGDFFDYIRDWKWKLNFCFTKVCHDYETQQLLYEYGLNLTNILDRLNIPSGVTWESRLKDVELDDSSRDTCFIRYQILQCMDRLQTCRELLLANSTDFEKTFRSFRDVDLVQQAHIFARSQQFNLLKVLFDRHGDVLFPHLYEILNSIPEVADPASFQHLLPAMCISHDTEIIRTQHPWRIQDWVETLCIKAQLPLSSIESLNLSHNFTCSVSEWYIERSRTIDRESLQTRLSLSLLQIGQARGVPNLEELTLICKVVISAVEAIPKLDISTMAISRFEELNAYELVYLFCKSCFENETEHSRQSFKQVYENIVKQMMVLKIGSQPRDMSECLLRSVSKFGPNSLQFVLNVLTFERDKVLLQDFVCQVLVLLLGMDVNDDELVAQVQAKIEQIMTPTTRTAVKENLKLLSQYLTVAILVKEYIETPTLKQLMTLRGSTDIQRRFLLKVVHGYFDSVIADSVYDIMTLIQTVEGVRRLSCPLCEPDVVQRDVLMSALSDGRQFKAVASLLSPTVSGSGTIPAPIKLDDDEIAEMFITASIGFFDNAKFSDVQDQNANLARQCLMAVPKLAPEAAMKIKSEFDFTSAAVECCEIFNMFGNAIIDPIQVRLSQDKLDIIRVLLVRSPHLYKNKSVVGLMVSGLMRDPTVMIEPKTCAALTTYVRTMCLFIEGALAQNDVACARKTCQDLIRVFGKTSITEGMEECQILCCQYVLQVSRLAEADMSREFVAFVFKTYPYKSRSLMSQNIMMDALKCWQYCAKNELE